MKLFLDDLRVPRDIYKNIDTDNGDWIVVRSFNEAAKFVQDNGVPEVISFDNDLGESQLEGYDFAKFLVEGDQRGLFTLPKQFSWNVHSANIRAWDNINCLLENYMKFKYGVAT